MAAGCEGLFPARAQQREWYRRVFANALSLEKEARRFCFLKGCVFW
ncbi:hypothetical protein HMPREF1546_01801 [Oscillibacter sp. KLE 1745]|nr:hypothetical protein HMPREF1546_01801 [Oscillibacter sp. KLE 1745]